ncbi:MAG: polyhydroxyalkanoate synthesis regulator DNA-binding domain-containing protein [Deltaproteobacteria bacterium]|nr:polyhydroxyalkanoate synthesis regulator DNA-binding domain-containing protein [Deltaproteobacteria bacterium]
MAERVLLKKYANRRLYDTEKSVYVTLSQVSDMIKGGRQVEVIDAKTEEDVTAFILTQIIVEEAKNKNSLLPVPLLHLIIEYGETVLSEFFEIYLELTIKNYLSYKTAFDEHFRKWLDIGGNLSALSQKNMHSFPSLPSLVDLFADSAKKSKEKHEDG